MIDFDTEWQSLLANYQNNTKQNSYVFGKGYYNVLKIQSMGKKRYLSSLNSDSKQFLLSMVLNSTSDINEINQASLLLAAHRYETAVDLLSDKLKYLSFMPAQYDIYLPRQARNDIGTTYTISLKKFCSNGIYHAFHENDLIAYIIVDNCDVKIYSSCSLKVIIDSKLLNLSILSEESVYILHNIEFAEYLPVNNRPDVNILAKNIDFLANGTGAVFRNVKLSCAKQCVLSTEISVESFEIESGEFIQKGRLTSNKPSKILCEYYQNSGSISVKDNLFITGLVFHEDVDAFLHSTAKILINATLIKLSGKQVSPEVSMVSYLAKFCGDQKSSSQMVVSDSLIIDCQLACQITNKYQILIGGDVAINGKLKNDFDGVIKRAATLTIKWKKIKSDIKPFEQRISALKYRYCRPNRFNVTRPISIIYSSCYQLRFLGKLLVYDAQIYMSGRKVNIQGEISNIGKIFVSFLQIQTKDFCLTSDIVTDQYVCRTDKHKIYGNIIAKYRTDIDAKIAIFHKNSKILTNSLIVKGDEKIEVKKDSVIIANRNVVFLGNCLSLKGFLQTQSIFAEMSRYIYIRSSLFNPNIQAQFQNYSAPFFLRLGASKAKEINIRAQFAFQCGFTSASRYINSSFISIPLILFTPNGTPRINPLTVAIIGTNFALAVMSFIPATAWFAIPTAIGFNITICGISMAIQSIQLTRLALSDSPYTPSKILTLMTGVEQLVASGATIVASIVGGVYAGIHGVFSPSTANSMTAFSVSAIHHAHANSIIHHIIHHDIPPPVWFGYDLFTNALAYTAPLRGSYQDASLINLSAGLVVGTSFNAHLISFDLTSFIGSSYVNSSLFLFNFSGHFLLLGSSTTSGVYVISGGPQINLTGRNMFFSTVDLHVLPNLLQRFFSVRQHSTSQVSVANFSFLTNRQTTQQYPEISNVNELNGP